MKCSHCNKEIVLVPSAKERAKKFGGVPSDYTKLFTIHADCALEIRKMETDELVKRQTEKFFNDRFEQRLKNPR